MRMLNRTIVTRVVAPAALLLGGAVACHSIVDLEEKPPTALSPQTFFRTDADAQSAVLGAYSLLAQGYGFYGPQPSYMWLGYQFSVMCEDNEMTCWNWLGGGWQGRMTKDYTATPWITDYAMVGRTNDILANVPGAAAITPAMKSATLAQAHFLRAYAYFDLIRRFGAVPLRTEPYKPDLSLGDLSRASYADIYKVIVEDLKAATDSLPATYSGLGQSGALPTQTAAWGLLAKVYLELAGHAVDTTTLNGHEAAYNDSARVAARHAMDDPNVGLETDYMSLFDPQHQNSSKEILFAAQSAAVNTSTNYLASYFGASNDCEHVYGCASGFVQMRPDFYETFEPQDKRIEHNKAITWSYHENPSKATTVLFDDSLQVLIAKGVVTSDVNLWDGGWDEQCASFLYPHHTVIMHNPNDPAKLDTVRIGVTKQIMTMKYNDMSNPSTVDPILLRYADVLLTYAEAENRVNPGSAAAVAALNQVRARSGATPFPAPRDTIPSDVAAALSADAMPINALEWAIWTERGHELYGEFQAVFDQKREGRWLVMENRVDQRKSHVGYYTDIAGYKAQGACRPRLPYQLVQPIPEAELGANQAIHQNTGW